MERNQLIAIIVIIIIVAGAGVAFIFMVEPIENEGYTYNEVEDWDSYIIATGDFDFIDVYTYAESEGTIIYYLQAHITTSELTYILADPARDGSDRNFVNKYMYRMSLWICVDGNFTEYRFPVSDSITYYVTFNDIDFVLFIYADVW